MKENKTRICPVCRKTYHDYPALSRKDNQTEICPKCGIREALVHRGDVRLGQRDRLVACVGCAVVKDHVLGVLVEVDGLDVFQAVCDGIDALIADADRQPILERSEVYSGVYGRASITFYAFNSNGNRGIACGLNNLQKLADGTPLGGHSRAEDDFADDDDEDFLS